MRNARTHKDTRRCTDTLIPHIYISIYMVACQQDNVVQGAYQTEFSTSQLEKEFEDVRVISAL